ncbi:adenomatous polyposis coli protein 2 [Platysternon megacephalum]|uniref:Adenomatous polyposis coli protein 2 n=1 Tax=Platysternon megacephalum TaxID=55544 RepID=A0A4D9EHQ5_9SAUR|nr:adenomatous polyposis coli protein 2 [Platysternon megacephalum]
MCERGGSVAGFRSSAIYLGVKDIQGTFYKPTGYRGRPGSCRLCVPVLHKWAYSEPALDRGKNGDNLREALLAMSVAGSLPPQYHNTMQVLVNPLLPGVKGRRRGNPNPLEPSPGVGASGIQMASRHSTRPRDTENLLGNYSWNAAALWLGGCASQTPCLDCVESHAMRRGSDRTGFKSRTNWSQRAKLSIPVVPPPGF